MNQKKPQISFREKESEKAKHCSAVTIATNTSLPPVQV